MQALVDLPLRVSFVLFHSKLPSALLPRLFWPCPALSSALLHSPQPLPSSALQKAAALDPHDVASQGGPEGEGAAARRDETCYSHTMAVLRLLLDRGAGEARS